MAEILQEELATFEAERARLLETSRGKFALVKGGAVLGVFDDRFEAIRSGYGKLGNVAFLVKQILDEDVVATFATAFKP